MVQLKINHMRKLGSVAGSTNTEHERSQGIALIGGMLFLPVVLALLCLAATAALLLKADTHLSAICDSQSYQIQSTMAKSLNQLFALNPKALALIREKERLEDCIAVAEPYEKAACSMALENVMIQKGILAAQQNALTLSANAAGRQGAFELERKMKDGKAKVTERDLQIQAIERGEIAPEYETVNDFSDRQRLEVNYVLRPLALTDSTLLTLLEARGIGPIPRSCAATISQSGRKYAAQPTEGGRHALYRF